MAVAGRGDPARIAQGLREDGAPRGLTELAALAVHAAASAPERLVDIYDSAAAGWLGDPPPAPTAPDLPPLPISAACWRALWNLAVPPGGRRHGYAHQMMDMAGLLDPGINARMAVAARAFPGVEAAAARGLGEAYDLERLAQHPPGSLARLVGDELLRPGSPISDPYWTSALPYLRHMPSPLNVINVHVIQHLALWSLVAGYSTRTLDRVALGGFLMGQVGHHYSALATAVTLAAAAERRPDNVKLMVDALLRGWRHGRLTPPLIAVDWTPLWSARLDAVRAALKVRPFESAYDRETAAAPGWTPRLV